MKAKDLNLDSLVYRLYFIFAFNGFQVLFIFSIDFVLYIFIAFYNGKWSCIFIYENDIFPFKTLSKVRYFGGKKK